MKLSRYAVSVLVTAMIVLLVFTSGCTGDSRSKTGLENASFGTQGTQTPVTTVPTVTDRREATETPAPGVTTTLDDVCVFGSKNCHLYETCTTNCLKDGVSAAECARVCCNTKCFDLPTTDEKVACSKVCLAQLSQPTPTLAPLDTP